VDKTIYLIDMNHEEVKEYLKRRDIAIIPVGSVEVHGPHLPLGTDSYIAEAFAKILAEEVDGIVFPTIYCTFTDTLKHMAGSIHVPQRIVADYLKQICIHAAGQGFKRIILLNGHGGNAQMLQSLILEIFDETGLPIIYLSPSIYAQRHGITKEVFGEKASDGAYVEGSAVLGAMEIIKKKCRVKVEDLKDVTEFENPYSAETSSGRVMRWTPGRIGFRRTDPCGHQPPRADLSAELGKDYIIRVAKALAPVVDDLADYIKNLGF